VPTRRVSRRQGEKGERVVETGEWEFETWPRRLDRKEKFTTHKTNPQQEEEFPFEEKGWQEEIRPDE